MSLTTDDLRVRVPATGEFRVNTQYGGRMEPAVLDPAIAVNELGLGLHPAGGAGERFADALLARLPASSAG